MPTVETAIDLIKPAEYDNVVNLLRDFFRGKKGFIEVPVQHRLSILAACEDPRTIGEFHYAGEVWPLPQTGQMWLEYELLRNPDAPGYFCVSTSYRNEPNPVLGRHNLIFPMFEFETHGSVESLKLLEVELLEFLGFGNGTGFPSVSYVRAAEDYGVKELTDREEKCLERDYGSVVFLEKFPESTSPFWNMKRIGRCSNKIDVILFGIETIGSAERSVNPQEMRSRFHSISNGLYAEILFARFGRRRVEEELERFLALNFFERCGGGIGMTRIIRALRLLRGNRG